MFPQANLPGQDLVWTVQGVERARLTKAGNLGIGTSTPAFKLDVFGAINAGLTSPTSDSSFPLMAGGRNVLSYDTGYTRFYTGGGGIAFSISATDTYYDNNTHHWRTAAGAVDLATLSAAVFNLLPAISTIKCGGVNLVGSGGSGNYNRLYDPAGTAVIQCSIADSYYDNATHNFRTIGGAANPLSISSAGLNMGVGCALKVNGTQVVAARVTGWGIASNGSKAAFNGATATLAQTSAAVAQLISDFTNSHGLIGA